MTVWTVPARVERVIDGDTLDVTLDLGWGLYKRDHVRVHGINAPEKNTEAGKLAKAYADALIYETRGPRLQLAEVTVVSHSLDKYGRALATVILSDGRSFGVEMVRAGHAMVWDGTGARPT